MTSTAVRSCSNIPCLNFLGEKSWRAAWRDGGSTWSKSFWNSSRSDAAFWSSGLGLAGPAATDVRREKRMEADRNLRSEIIVRLYFVGEF